MSQAWRTERRGWWQAVLRQRCPRCRYGPVFRRGLTMYERCPACDHRFQREPGYFLGAMYISYPLSLVVLGAATWAIHLLWPDLRLDVAVTLAVLPLLVCVPAIVRYSRVLWMHFDPPWE